MLFNCEIAEIASTKTSQFKNRLMYYILIRYLYSILYTFNYIFLKFTTFEHHVLLLKLKLIVFFVPFLKLNDDS